VGKMKEIDLRPDELEFAGKFWDLTEEEKRNILPKLTGCQKRFFRHFSVYYNYKIIAEVSRAKNCIRNARVGDRMVFNGMGAIMYNESSFHCAWATSAVLPVIYSITDRIMDDLEPNLMGLDYVKCPDMEPEEGGTGSVHFKIKVIKNQCVMPANAHRPGIDEFFPSKPVS
jgi:uncharacterized repeat protein (TIGR04076 family)